MPVSPLSPVAWTPCTVPASVRPPVRGSMREIRPGRSEIQIVESGPHSMSQGVSRPPAITVTVKSSPVVLAAATPQDVDVAPAINSAAKDFSKLSAMGKDSLPQVHVQYPDWVKSIVDWDKTYASDEQKMRLAISVSRANVESQTGGPFGAAIFEALTGKLVAVGMNSVVRLNNCTLHGEMVAFMMAQQRVGSFTLNAPGMSPHELFTSCEPCAMCLGATLWSGVRRVVYGAGREDASKLKFEEGPVFPASYRYLEERGITIKRNVLRDEARAVLQVYRAT